QGYQCAGLYDDGRLIGICGLWILTKYYVGKHIEPDNVVIQEDIGPEVSEEAHGVGA
ncbi:GCN5-related N-acetyltransferase, partial [mine drainage metagenome]